MRLSGTARILATGAATGWAGKLVAVLTSLITLPLVLTALGAEQYGIWILIGQTITFIGLADLGITNALGRFIAQARGRGDQHAKIRILTTALALLLLLALVVLLITLLLAPFIAELLHIEAPYAELARTVFLITGIALAAQFPLRIGFGVLAGYQRYATTNLAKLVPLLLNLAGVLMLAATDRLQLVPLALLSAGTTLAGQLTVCLVAWRLTRMRFEGGHVSREVARDILGLGGSAFGITFSSAIYRQGIVIAVGTIGGLRAAAVYGVVLTVITHLSSILMELPRPMATLASEWNAQNSATRLRNNTVRLMSVALALAISAAGVLFVYGAAILRLLLAQSDWTSAEFRTAGVALSIMGAGLALGIPQMVSRSVLQGVGWHWAVMRRFALASAISFGVAFAGLQLGYGVVGAAIGWATAWLLQGTLMYPQLIRRALDLPIGAMIRDGYAPGAAVGGAVAFCTALIAAIFPPLGLNSIVLGLAAAGAACAGALVLMLRGPRWRATLLGGRSSG